MLNSSFQLSTKSWTAVCNANHDIRTSEITNYGIAHPSYLFTKHDVAVVSKTDKSHLNKKLL